MHDLLAQTVPFLYLTTAHLSRAKTMNTPERLALVTEMAYQLKLVPREDIVPVQILEVVGLQFDAAMAAMRTVAQPYGYLFGNSFWEQTNRRLTDDIRRLGRPLYAEPLAP